MAYEIDLPVLDKNDSVVVLIDRLKEGLRNPAEQGIADEYVRTRAILRRHPMLKGHLPDFLQQCRTIAEYRQSVDDEVSGGAAWDARYGRQLNSLKKRARSASSLDEYEIERPIGSGAYGRVYLARRVSLDRNFAIKIFSPVFNKDGGADLSRFFQEAGMLYELQHPRIVAIRDVGIYNERPFIVMDYFDGTSLSKALKQEGAMPPLKAVRMIELLAGAIGHAHEKGIVHRDLTPSNVLLAPNDCRVIDFGLGVYVERHLASRLTKAGGTPVGGAYTARELLSDPRLIDPRSDVYSIGAIWYHAVTNHVPAGSTPEDLLRDAPGLPSQQVAIILRCLRDVKDRFPSCEELIAAIHEVPSLEKQP
jgi:eukaryotic-like serine/threonine-protein kinase